MTGKMFIHDKVDKTFIINHQSNVNMIIRLTQFRFLQYKVITKYEICKISQTERSALVINKRQCDISCMIVKNQLRYGKILNNG